MKKVFETEVDTDENINMMAILNGGKSYDSDNDVTNEFSNLHLSKSLVLETSRVLDTHNVEVYNELESDLDKDDDLEAIKETEVLECTFVEEEENNIEEEDWADVNDRDELFTTETYFHVITTYLLKQLCYQIKKKQLIKLCLIC